MSDSKKTSNASSAKVEKKTTKPAVVKKVSTNNAEERQMKAAIDKYKDIPLGELYEDLNGTEVYKDILRARREELVKAKSIVDSGKRKVAIAKTSENTVDIEFKYQKNASFKNHYVPKGDYKIVGSTGSDNDMEDGAPARARERIINRSEERIISEQQASIGNVSLIRSHSPEAPRQVTITSQLEQRQDRVISAQPAPVPMAAPAATPTPQPQPQPAMAPMAAPAATPTPQPQFQPQPVMAPMATPMEQQPFTPTMPQPMATPVPTTTPGVATQPAVAPTEQVALHKKHKLWPLYEQIEIVSKNAKSSKVVFTFTIILSAILAILVALFVLWGFAINWDFPQFIDTPIQDAFSNLFSPLFKK